MVSFIIFKVYQRVEEFHSKIGLIFSLMFTIGTLYRKIMILTQAPGGFFITVVVICQMNSASVKAAAFILAIYFVFDFMIQFNQEHLKEEMAGASFIDFYSKIFLIGIWCYFIKQRGMIRFIQFA